jgi:hypothetical protein
MKFDVNKPVESRLNLKPDKDKYNGLVLAEIESVEVKDFLVPEIDDKGSESKSEFKGVTVPRISITWRNHKVATEEEDRFHTLSYGVIVTVTKDGTPVSAADIKNMYENMYANLMHNHNAFKKSVNYKPILSLPDIEENAVPELRAKQTKAFFEAFAKAFNGENGKAIYLDEKGSPIPVWLKLVTGYRDSTRYETPTFVGQGYTEVAIMTDKGWKKPTVELKPKESIDLIAKGSKKANNVNIDTNQSGISPELQKILDENSGK